MSLGWIAFWNVAFWGGLAIVGLALERNINRGRPPAERPTRDR